MQKRTVSLYAAVCLLLTALLFRTVALGSDFSSDVLNAARRRTLVVGVTRGKIYDRAFRPLVDDTSRLVAAVTPLSAAASELESALGKEAAASLLERGVPQLIPVDAPLQSDCIRTFPVPVRTSSTCACHLIGTVDANGHGVSGVEHGCDALLSAWGGSLSVRFEVDAAGRALAGYEKQVLDNNYNCPAGVVLTIDKRIQALTEQALDKSVIQRGCALVMAANSGEILAMASRPVFEKDAPDDALNDPRAPLLNKTLLPYAAGSVFKPLVAAYALEHGIPADTTFQCDGICRVGDTVFRCYGGKAHGKQTMAEALAHSCNTYFIALMEQMDPADFLHFCRTLGLGAALPLGAGIVSSGGHLPQEHDLSLPGERANLAFGQGTLLLTPVQLLSCYHTLATGLRVDPSVLRGETENGVTLKVRNLNNAHRLLSESTVRTLRRLLRGAANAESSRAKSDRISLAGKTGTAQSGVVEDGAALCRTWFAGFFPAEAPQYIIVVMNEAGNSGNADCAPVFKAICETLP